jgi:hypothetical protein
MTSWRTSGMIFWMKAKNILTAENAEVRREVKNLLDKPEIALYAVLGG